MTTMTSTKKELGQFFTKGNWLNSTISDIILPTITERKKVLDPFAGAGDLNIFETEFFGYDIDNSLGWPVNNGIVSIPSFDGVIITNPPYLAKNSAKRQGFSFPESKRDDLYKIAIDNCLKACNKVVAIIPENAISNGGWDFDFVDILEENPFEDTEYPVCVMGWGFDSSHKYYKNGVPLDVSPQDITYKGDKPVAINKKGGGYTFKLIDGVGAKDRIRLMPLQERPVKPTDRAYCCITVEENLDISDVNRLIEEYREKTQDVFIKAFKGNNSDNKRRRTLVQNQAKGFIEMHLKGK